MNIYQKLQTARVELQNMKLKKTGKNQTITYYELGDFLPAINALGDKHGFITRFSIINNVAGELATLDITDTEGEQETVSFNCPTAEVELPRGQKIQGQGAKITYMRRYMLMIAFEIVESDMVDRLAIDLKDAVEPEDEEKIRACKTQDELQVVCNTLTAKYKQSLITPYFKEMKTRITQNESKA